MMNHHHHPRCLVYAVMMTVIAKEERDRKCIMVTMEKVKVEVIVTHNKILLYTTITTMMTILWGKGREEQKGPKIVLLIMKGIILLKVQKVEKGEKVENR